MSLFSRLIFDCELCLSWRVSNSSFSRIFKCFFPVDLLLPSSRKLAKRTSVQWKEVGDGDTSLQCQPYSYQGDRLCPPHRLHSFWDILPSQFQRLIWNITNEINVVHQIDIALKFDFLSIFIGILNKIKVS